MAEFLGILLIGGPDLLLGDVRGDDLLHVADADALLHGEDHDEIGDVDAEILPLDRRGHNPQPDVVVDCGGSHDLLILAVLPSGAGGDKAQVPLEQDDDLIHIQAEIRDSIPFREMIVRDVVVPPLQLVCQQLIIAMHVASPVIQSGIIISADVASCKEKRYGSP